MGDQLFGDQEGLILFTNGVATAAALAVLIAALGPISGAHFNPAVTLVMALRGELSARDSAAYVVVQLVAALAGVMLANAMFGLPAIEISDKVRWGSHLWLSEVVGTYGLVAVILLTVRYRESAVPWAVGLFILAAIWFTASTGFANPAVALSRFATDTFTGIAPTGCLPFVAAEVLGALLAWVTISPLLQAD